jgi:hypothetical protein
MKKDPSGKFALITGDSQGLGRSLVPVIIIVASGQKGNFGETAINIPDKK